MLYGFSGVILQGALVTLELAISSVVLAVLIGPEGFLGVLIGNLVTSVLMIPLTIILIRMGLGLYGAWYALAADQLLRSALVLARYQSGKWKTIRLRNEV